MILDTIVVAVTIGLIYALYRAAVELYDNTRERPADSEVRHEHR